MDSAGLMSFMYNDLVAEAIKLANTSPQNFEKVVSLCSFVAMWCFKFTNFQFDRVFVATSLRIREIATNDVIECVSP